MLSTTYPQIRNSLENYESQIKTGELMKKNVSEKGGFGPYVVAKML